jgi:hypothetical protein
VWAVGEISKKFLTLRGAKQRTSRRRPELKISMELSNYRNGKRNGSESSKGNVFNYAFTARKIADNF